MQSIREGVVITHDDAGAVFTLSDWGRALELQRKGHLIPTYHGPDTYGAVTYTLAPAGNGIDGAFPMAEDAEFDRHPRTAPYRDPFPCDCAPTADCPHGAVIRVWMDRHPY